MATNHLTKGLKLLGLASTLIVLLGLSKNFFSKPQEVVPSKQELASQSQAGDLKTEETEVSLSVRKTPALQKESATRVNDTASDATVIHSPVEEPDRLAHGETHDHEECLKSMMLGQKHYGEDETKDLRLEDFISEENALALEELEEELLQNSVLDADGNEIDVDRIHDDFERSIAELEPEENSMSSDSHY